VVAVGEELKLTPATATGEAFLENISWPLRSVSERLGYVFQREVTSALQQDARSNRGQQVASCQMKIAWRPERTIERYVIALARHAGRSCPLSLGSGYHRGVRP
jgi:hypothetical protein